MNDIRDTDTMGSRSGAIMPDSTLFSKPPVDKLTPDDTNGTVEQQGQESEPEQSPTQTGNEKPQDVLFKDIIGLFVEDERRRHGS